MKYLINRSFYRFKEEGLLKIIKLFFKFILKNDKKIDLDNINITQDKTLDEIFLIFGTDKGKLDGKKTF